MDYSNIPLAPIATLVATFITALITFVNLTLSKEQKTSEFRQEWINGLRSDLAIFFSSARALCRVMQEARSQNCNDEDVECFRFSKDQVSKMRFEGGEALYRVKLRLNNNEREHLELNVLLDKVTTIQNEININKGRDYTEALNAIEQTSSYAKDIIKKEWERVKRGENSFYMAKIWVMPLLIIISLSLLITFIFFSSREPNKSIEPTVKASIHKKYQRQARYLRHEFI